MIKRDALRCVPFAYPSLDCHIFSYEYKWGADMKKIIAFLMALILLICPTAANAISDDDKGEVDEIISSGMMIESIDSALVGADPSTLEIKALSYILVEASSGKVLVEHNAKERMSPASITKIMTLLLVMEALEDGKITLEDNVTCSEHANSMGGTQIWLKVGETMSVHELLKAVVVSSANDATVALAEHVAGSEEGFTKLMNDRAKQLGMNDTTFTNATGFDDENHKTTAYDISLMSRELLKHQKIFEYTSIWMDSLRGGETQLVNTNKLIRFYKGANGLKTGTTVGAGYCLAATALRDGMQLIAVNLGSSTTDDRFFSARKLLDYGFANYEVTKPEISLEELTPVKVAHGTKREVSCEVANDNTMLLQKGQKSQIVQEVILEELVEAPIDEGQQIGKIVMKLDGEIVGECPVTAAEAVEKMTILKSLELFLKNLVSMK